MKLLVFAHVPPPHHGQAVMVQCMLEGLKNRDSLEIFHVNAQLSDNISDVGGIRLGKLFRLFGYCLQAIQLRITHRIDSFYYIPAPAKKSAVLRDWLVMLLLRPWFKKTIFHWHAFGLGHWATGSIEHPSGNSAPPLKPPMACGVFDPAARALTRLLMSHVDLSMVLTEYNKSDALLLNPKQIAVVPNGIPDPCPDFEATILPERQKRHEARFSAINNQQSAISTFKCLFLAHCTAEKGLFDAIDAIALVNQQLEAKRSPDSAGGRKANQQLANAHQGSDPLTVRQPPDVEGVRPPTTPRIVVTLEVAGQFVSEAERQRFEQEAAKINEQSALASGQSRPQGVSGINNQVCIRYLGFVSGAKKDKLLRECDCLIFPTRYREETFGLTIIEAALYGMPSLVSNWRSLPEIAGSQGHLSSQTMAAALGQMVLSETAITPEELRAAALESFSLDSHLKLLTEALLLIDEL